MNRLTKGRALVGAVTTGKITLNNGETIDNDTNGLVNVTGKLNCTGDFSVATNKLTVASASGNTTVTGTLSVTGAATFSDKIDIGTYVNFTPGSAPSSPAEGDVYYDSAAQKLKVYNGSSWETITSS